MEEIILQDIIHQKKRKRKINSVTKTLLNNTGKIENSS